jgi:hypothetical protein
MLASKLDGRDTSPDRPGRARRRLEVRRSRRSAVRAGDSASGSYLVQTWLRDEQGRMSREWRLIRLPASDADVTASRVAPGEVAGAKLRPNGRHPGDRTARYMANEMLFGLFVLP